MRSWVGTHQRIVMADGMTTMTQGENHTMVGRGAGIAEGEAAANYR